MRFLKETNRMNIVLDTEKKEISVTQKWKYIWQTVPIENPPEWNFGEQDRFCENARNIIQRLWNNKICFKVKPAPGKTSPFAGQYAGVEFNVSVDIQEVMTGEHWKVFVSKFSRSYRRQALVNWNNREIQVTSKSIRSTTAKLWDGSKRNKQYRIAHEFGHTLGNIGPEDVNEDEYYPDHIFSRDINSIMCIGNEVRGRHFFHLQTVLEEMIPDTQFLIILK